jgi:nucleoside-diphosphate-sugar epimerase
VIRGKVAWVGADGALGQALAPALGAHPVSLRCPDLGDDRPVAGLEGFDVVIHAAGPRVHPGLGWGDYLREHVGTVERVARSMRAGTHLVLVSSAAVYGSGRGRVGTWTPTRPDTFPVPAYAWATLAAEHAARALASERRLSLTVLRPSIIYGPGAGGVILRLRDLARKGVVVELVPAATQQHLLHIALFQRVLEGLMARAAPESPELYLVADPFVVATADLNAAYAAAGPRVPRVPVPIGLLAGGLRIWQRRSGKDGPGPLAVAAMLGLDNVYDAAPCFVRAGVDPGEFGPAMFEAFLAS